MGTMFKASEFITDSRGQSSHNLNIHHIDYDRIGQERFGDLIVICADCHEYLHERIERMRKGGKRTARKVMDRIKPVMVRRLLAIHESWRTK